MISITSQLGQDTTIDRIVYDLMAERRGSTKQVHAPLPEVLEVGDPNCVHHSVISSATGLEECVKCHRVRKYTALFYQDLVDSAEKSGRERGISKSVGLRRKEK